MQTAGQKMEFKLGELVNSADFIILGLQDCLRLGLRLDKDDDGNCWVHLEKPGLWRMAESTLLMLVSSPRAAVTGPSRDACGWRSSTGLTDHARRCWIT